MKNKRLLSLALLALSFIMTLQFAACNPSDTNQEHTTVDTIEDTTQDAVPESQAPDTEADAENTTEDTTDATTEDTTEPPAPDKQVAAKPVIDFDKAVQVSQNGGDASVTTATGLAYIASGYSQYANGSFTVNANYKVKLDGSFADKFNRLTLCYVSDAPLKCTVTYVLDGKTVSDLFYLEAGKQTFCALTLGYLAGKQASDLTEISFSTCEKKNAAFVLCDVKTEIYEVYADDVYYLQNDAYELGVRLSWGGGICYLRDLKSKIGGIKNLINQADTGRLVQQSYYGTQSNGEYVNGDYNGTPWPYNPVQGGDVHGNPSRIIDVVVGDASLYIKAQPQDWGHNGDLTISYMENVYVLEDDHIRVDNRFVDFSGWEHRYANQELPAFYTLSYFDEFTYYAGSKPWQDQPLFTRDNLNFWGDPKYHDDCVFKIRNSNTETWCAWTNGMIDYGIGIYVPNIDILLAGRHAYNGSKDSKNGATNYVAPLCTMKMVSFEPIEYSYMMTTGSLEEIRSTFKANKDFATNESLHKNYISERIEDEGAAQKMNKLVFDNENTSLKLQPMNNAATGFDKSQNAAVLTVAGGDPYVNIDYTRSEPKLKAGDYSKIVVTYMIPTSNSKGSYRTELFLCTGSLMNAEGGKSVTQQIVADGEYHTIEFNVSGLAFWSGNINAIRFDFFDGGAEGDVIYVRSIELK
ncbi:MAG: hypothetical protein IIX86_06430 [Clostridia bacterium]|nr:hypothetical protein [Clostridia bacterium]